MVSLKSNVSAPSEKVAKVRPAITRDYSSKVFDDVSGTFISPEVLVLKRSRSCVSYLFVPRPLAKWYEDCERAYQLKRRHRKYASHVCLNTAFTRSMDTYFEADEAPAFDQQRASAQDENPAPLVSDITMRGPSTSPTLSNLLNREFLRSTGHTWSTSIAALASVGAITVPAGIFSTTTPVVRSLINHHLFVRFKVRITIRLNATPFMSGQLLLTVRPGAAPDSGIISAPAKNDWLLYTHSFLNVAFETFASVDCDFLVPYSFNPAPLSHTPYTGDVFSLIVWNPLKVATGNPTTLNWSIWYSFLDVQLGPKVSLTHTTFEGGSVSTTAISPFSAVVGNNVTSSTFTVPDEYEGALSDAPKVAGDFRVLSRDHPVCSELPPASLVQVLQVYGRLHRIQWTTSQASQEQLLSIVTNINQQGSTVPADNFSIPLLNISRHFRYWRGTLKLKFEIIATRFHQGQLLVAWQPFYSGLTFAGAQEVYYMSIDIGQQNVFEMEVPFVFHRDVMLCSQATGGVVKLFVQNPLIAPGTVSTEVDINVYLAGADDFQFFESEPSTLSGYSTFVEAGDEISFSGRLKSTIWNPLGERPGRQFIFSENHCSLKHLLKRRFVIGTFNLESPFNKGSIIGVGALPYPGWRRFAQLPLWPFHASTYQLIKRNAAGALVTSDVNFEGDYLPQEFVYRRGGLRYTLVFSTPQTAAYEYVAVLSSGTDLIRLVVQEANDITVSVPPVSRSGLCTRNPNDLHAWRIDVPHYSDNSYYTTREPATPSGISLPFLELYFRGSSAGEYITLPADLPGVVTAGPIYTPASFTLYAEDADDVDYFFPCTNPVRTIGAFDSGVKCERRVERDAVSVHAGLRTTLQAFELPSHHPSRNYGPSPLPWLSDEDNLLMDAGHMFLNAEFLNLAPLERGYCLGYNQLGENPPLDVFQIPFAWRDWDHELFDRLYFLQHYFRHRHFLLPRWKDTADLGTKRLFLCAEYDALSDSGKSFCWGRGRYGEFVRRPPGGSFTQSFSFLQNQLYILGHHQRADLAPRVRYRSIFSSLPTYYQNNALFSFLSTLSGAFSGIGKTMKGWWESIKRVFRLTTLATTIYGKWEEIFPSIKRMLKTLFNSVLPLLTAAHTLFYGGSAMRVVAMASIGNILGTALFPTEHLEGSVAFTADENVANGDEFFSAAEDAMSSGTTPSLHTNGFGYLSGGTVNPIDPDDLNALRLARLQRAADQARDNLSAETARLGVHSPTLADVVRNGRPAAARLSTRAEVGENHLLGNLSKFGDILSNTFRCFFTGFFKPFGILLGPDYHKYLRRRCVEVDQDTFSYFAVEVLASLEYALYGASLNVEYDRKINLEAIALTTRFNSFVARGAFVGNQLDSVIGSTTHFGVLTGMREAAKKLRLCNSEVVFPLLISRGLIDIESTYGEACRLRRLEVTQAEPTAAFFCGDPGVGKSLIVSQFLPRILLSRCGLPASQNSVFPIPSSEHKFWDNYNQQPYVYFDEFLQLKDGEDPMVAIKVISTAKTPVNMASLSNKGILFDSPFFVASSNERNLQNVNTIYDTRALARRFVVSVEVAPRVAYSTGGMLDFAKFSTAFDACTDSNSLLALLDQVWTFTPINLLKGSLGTVTMTFSEIVSTMAATHHSRSANFKKIESKLVTLFQSDDEPDFSGLRLSMDSDDFLSPYTDAIVDLAATPYCLWDAFLEVHNSWTVERDHSAANAIYYSDLATIRVNEFLPDLYPELHDRIKEYQRDGRTPPFFSLFRDEFDDHPPDLVIDVLTTLDIISRKAILPSLMKRWVGIFGICSVVLGASALIVVALRRFTNVFSLLRTTLQGYSGKAAKVVPKPVAAAAAVAGLLTTSEMCEDRAEAVRKNVRFIKLVRPDGSTSILHCLCLDSQTIVLPNHLFAGGSGHLHISTHRDFEGTLHWEPLPVENYQISVLEDRDVSLDLAVIVFSTYTLSNSRDITHFLMREKDRSLCDHKRESILLSSPVASGSHDFDIDCTVAEWCVFDDRPNLKFLLAEVATPTARGDCGRPYFLCNNAQHPVAGLHCLGTATNVRGIAPLFWESVQRAKFRVSRAALTLPVPTIYEDSHESLNREDAHIIPVAIPCFDPTLEAVGRVSFSSRSLTIHAPGRSNLVPLTWRRERLFHPDWDCDYLPAAQKPMCVDGVLKHHLFSNASKYAVHKPLCIRPLHQSIVTSFYLDRIAKGDGRLFPMDVCINGNGVTQPLVFTTGAGYWSLFGFAEGKKDFFVELPQLQDDILRRDFSQKAKEHVVPFYGLSFTDRLAQCEDLIRTGSRFLHFWVTTTKDELRPAAKVRACKTRVFEQPGLEFVLLTRRYFGAFIEWYKQHPGFHLFHGIGLDKEAAWASYAKGFAEVGYCGHAFDYVNWDGSVTAEAFAFFLAVTDHFYYGCDNEDRLARHALVAILREGYHIVGPFVFRTAHGNKSGNPFTDVFNSVCNSFVMLCAFFYCQSMAGLPNDLSVFDSSVRMLTYGDDVAITCRPDITSWYTGPRVQEVLALVGYTITDALKRDSIPAFISFSEITFLKSPFVYEPQFDVFLAPIPKKDIYKELKYAPRTVIGDEIDIRQRVSVTTRFMAHHGRAAYVEFIRQLREVGIPSPWLTTPFEAHLCDIREKQANFTSV